MSLMMSSVWEDGEPILASCPFYANNPLCVNSCALFCPEVENVEGESIVDYRYGKCGMTQGRGQTLYAVDPDTEKKIREKRIKLLDDLGHKRNLNI